jgi:hypothetical protein
MHDAAALLSRLPLPAGVASALYVGDMREVVAYDIARDEFKVRYDWLEDGKKKTYIASPIDAVDFSVGVDIHSLEERRAECMKMREGV